MGNLLRRLKHIEIFVNRRRNDKYYAHLSKSDHPESLPPDKLTTVEDVEQKSKPMPTSTTTTPSVAMATLKSTESARSSNTCSNFYLACRNNNIDEVKRLLQTMKLDEIDRIEPNGSTALHAACFHGHQHIVKLLLEAGADRAIPNRFKCLPFDEAKNDGIKQLFYRIPTCNRFISNTGAIEWDLIDDDVLESAAEERHQIKSVYNNVSGATPIGKMFEKIEKNYINKGLTNFNGIENIKRFFTKATEEQDPIWIIKAYTAETDFYKILNSEIAGGASKYQQERRYIIALLSYHPKLDDISYIGTSYRVMQMNEDDLKKYQNKSQFMTKSFLSSSIDQKIAAWFLCRQELAREESGQPERSNANGQLIKQWVMCIYNIKHRRTALHIENSSQYANEGEILIMPNTVFQVKNSRQIKASYLPDGLLINEIELEECDQYLNRENQDT